MIGNIIIATVAVIIIMFVTKVFITNKRDILGYKYTAIVLTIFLFFSILVPNIDWVKSPLTATVKKQIIDSETNRPLQGVKVIISTGILWGVWPAGQTINYTFEVVETDFNGFYTVTPRLKPISIMVYPIFGRSRTLEINALLLKDGYKCEYVGIYDDSPVALAPIKNKQQCLENDIRINTYMGGFGYTETYNAIIKQFYDHNNILCKKLAEGVK